MQDVYKRQEIRCTHRPLPELLISLGERFGPPFQSFLVETGKELEAHKSLTVQEVWKEQLILSRKKFHLNRQEDVYKRQVLSMKKNYIL